MAEPFRLNTYFEKMASGSRPETNQIMSNELLRVSSFCNFPREIDISLIRLAQAGFYYTGEANETRCYLCGVTYRHWVSNDSPRAVHRLISPNCDLASNTGFANCHSRNQSRHDHDDAVGVISYKMSKYPRYSSLQMRISTFQTWPSYINQSQREMAMAGFLFTGYNDYVRCFFCGGGLRNWEMGDDPWVEHARWFPMCNFLRENKGDMFIHDVQRMNQEKESKDSLSTLKRITSSQLCNKKNFSDQQSVDVRHGLEASYTEEKDQSVQNETNIFTTAGLTGIPATDTYNYLLCNQKQIQERVSADKFTGTIIWAHPEISGADFSANIDTESMIEENRRLRDQRICKVCLDLDATVAFMPCGHLVCCTHCAFVMHKCPVCREFITETVKIFLA